MIQGRGLLTPLVHWRLRSNTQGATEGSGYIKQPYFRDGVGADAITQAHQHSSPEKSLSVLWISSDGWWFCLWSTGFYAEARLEDSKSKHVVGSLKKVATKLLQRRDMNTCLSKSLHKAFDLGVDSQPMTLMELHRVACLGIPRGRILSSASFSPAASVPGMNILLDAWVMGTSLAELVVLSSDCWT